MSLEAVLASKRHVSKLSIECARIKVNVLIDGDVAYTVSRGDDAALEELADKLSSFRLVDQAREVRRILYGR
jgi:hypothetical protein